ncbi:MAG: GNAT family N-acetyltransferase [Bacteroidota bacterium]
MINYRTGTEKDIQPIAKLLIETWNCCYKEFIPAKFLRNLQIDRQIQRHKKYISKNTKYYIAENAARELIGFTSYGKNRLEKINCEKELYTLYVKKAYHGRGIGKSLIDLIWSDLKNSQKKIAVTVFKKNPFKNFYIKNGFVKIDEEIINLGEFELIGEIYIKQDI